jgi:hypothetical protein
MLIFSLGMKQKTWGIIFNKYLIRLIDGIGEYKKVINSKYPGLEIKNYTALGSSVKELVQASKNKSSAKIYFDYMRNILI